MLKCENRKKTGVIVMMEYSPMMDLVTTPVVNSGEKLRKMYQELSERARRRNEEIALGYARMNYLHFLEQEEKSLKHSGKKEPV